jgi:hypothetical protein
MQMRKARQVIAGAGLLMLSAVLTLASTLWTPWIQVNAATVLHLMEWLGAGASICFFLWLLTKDQATERTQTLPSKIEQNVEAPSTPSATSYGNIVNVYTAGTSSEHQPPAVTQALPADHRIPDLTLKVGWGTVEGGYCKFEFNNTGGRRAYIAEVINNPAPTHGVTYPARRIVARINFKCGAKHLFIDRAFWVGREENEIDLAVGRTAQILVGIVNGTQWTLFENPNSTPFNQMEWNAQHDEPVVREFPDMGAEPIVIEIHVISVADWNQSRTLLHKRILVEIEGELGFRQIKTRFF